MAGAPDALDRYLANQVATQPGRDTPGAGAGLGGAYDPVSSLANPGDVGAPPPPPGAPAPTTTFDPTIDYSKLFDFFGLPADIKQKIQDIIAQSQGEVSIATPLVLGYIRGTDWYAKTYQGIQYGIASGEFNGSSPERDYRAYVNSANLFYQQYLNRAVGTDEIVNALKEGVGVDVLGKRLEGQSYANANSNDWQYELGAFGGGQTDQAGVTALGQEGVGLKSQMGDRLQAQLDKAHARMMALFQGTLASPNLQKTSTGGLATNSNVKPDVGA